MAGVIKLGSIKRFGVRYGRSLKERVAEAEKDHKKKHKCPYCNYVKVKRLASGIWFCRKCKARFTGRAYSIKEKIFVEDVTTDKKTEGVNNG